MVTKVATILFCLGICLCVVMMSLCHAGGPVPCPESYCAPAPQPCGPPPCAPPACGGPSPFSFCGGILGACSGICGAVIGIPAAIMGGILAPPRLPGAGCAPPMCRPACPPPVCQPQMCCAPPVCAPPAYPQPITKCRPTACGPGYAYGPVGYR